MPPRLTAQAAEQRRADVARLYGEGTRQVEIASLLGLQASTVGQVLRELGLANTNGIRLWQDIEHVAFSLHAASARIDALTKRLEDGELFTTSEQEIKKCLSKMRQSLASIRALRSSLAERAKEPQPTTECCDQMTSP